MAERRIDKYSRLLEVSLLHHYWLDEGATVFDRTADQAKKDARLLDYDIRPFLAIRPTPATELALRSLRCLFRQTSLGFLVVAPEGATFSVHTILDFIVAVKQPEFFDYTALTLRPQTLYELPSATDGITYRYKENVAVLSNLTGAKRGSGAATALFLSGEIPPQGAGDPVESLVLSSGGALLQSTSDGPAAATQQLSPQATDMPVYVHQADAPAIVPPAGLAGAPSRGVRLTDDIADDVFALIRLAAKHPGDSAFSFVDDAGAPKAVPPIYQVRWKSRSTVWTYRNKTTGAVKSTEAGPLPLTRFGNAGTGQKPSQGLVKPDMAGRKITRLVSDIYV